MRMVCAVALCSALVGCGTGSQLEADSGPDQWVFSPKDSTVDTQPTLPQEPQCGAHNDYTCDDQAMFCPANCLVPQAVAACIAQPVASQCAQVNAPVCGCDGVTYPSQCLAHANRIAVAHPGACGPVTFAANKQTVVEGSPIVGTLRNSSQLPVYAADCGGLGAQRRVGDRWVDHPIEQTCSPLIAELLTFGKSRSDSVELPPGTWRLKASYGQGCDPQLPMHADHCEKLSTVYSESITVTPIPCKNCIPQVELLANGAVLSSQDPVSVRLVNHGPGSIWTLSCQPISRQRYEWAMPGGVWDQMWVTYPSGPITADWAQPASQACLFIELPPGAFLKRTLESKPGRWRATGSYWPCSPYAPVPQCQSQQVTSATFDIVPDASVCSQLSADYAAALPAATSCSVAADCQQVGAAALDCDACDVPLADPLPVLPSSHDWDDTLCYQYAACVNPPSTCTSSGVAICNAGQCAWQ